MWSHGRQHCWDMHQNTGSRVPPIPSPQNPIMPVCSCNNWSNANVSMSAATASTSHQSYMQQQQQPQHHQMHHHQTTRNYNSTASNSRITSQWYSPPSAPNFFVTDTPASNSREMRNRAEKLRRDKLNSYIGELATLVPMVSGSAKRMDKTSILRLAATYLRIYHTLLHGQMPKNEFNHVDPNALEKLLLEQLEGFLLIVSPTGKIVFVSHTVEQLLGHLQTDLMGQSIYTISSSEDHEKLRLHLSLDILDAEWRRYFNLHLAKAGPRTESPTYEQFSVMGMLRPSVEGRGSKKSKEVATSSNKNQNNVLVFFVKLYRPPALLDMLIEANKDEYITRHLIDGRIINCDHRISFVAGYMIEEISGLSAFKFMHREDVRWTMIALRQMYDRGESVGWSCYRLLSRTGQFIYLRTFGYLEVDNSGVVESFVCVNTLVSEDEGKKLIKEMKERYSVMINAANYMQLNEGLTASTVEDPSTLDECIKLLITNHVPKSPKTENSSSPISSALNNESQDCSYTLTELTAHTPAEPLIVTDSVNINIKTKTKRAPNDIDETVGATRKRQKRRTVSNSSASSSELILESYQSTTESNSTGNIILHQTGSICRPNVTDIRHKDQTSVYQSINLLSHN